MGRQAREAEDVLAYWRAVEMFDPRDIPSPSESTGRRTGERCVEQIRFAGDGAAPPFPWEPEHQRYGEEPAAGKFGSEWRHFVYGGLFGYRPVRDVFARVLGYEPRPDYGGTRRDADSAMFAFAVDQRGRLIEGAASFSSCAWAVGRLHRPGPGAPAWLEGFEKATRDLERTLTRVLEGRPGTVVAGNTVAGGKQDPGQGEGQRGVRAKGVFEFSKAMAKELGLPEEIADHYAIRVVSTPVFRRRDGTLSDPEPVILSSMIAPDLQRVRDAMADGFGTALASYLSEPLPPDERIDLAADRAALLDGVRPSAFPLARWPADTASPLTMSQQFAVNTIMSSLGGKRGSGLFSVNGPPGTGKTTLLRDLIAAIIAARAEALAELKEPGDAFTKEGAVWRPKRQLTGFEIVVASSNNAAVENVTTELPALTAIGDEWHGLADYLGEQATTYLGAPAWGAIAVPLGKVENRLRFRDKLWFADGGLYQFLRAREREQRGVVGTGAEDVAAWHAAVDTFKTALRDASRLARERDVIDAAVRTPVSPADIDAARGAVAEAERRHSAAKGKVSGLAARVRALRRQLDQARDRKQRTRLQTRIDQAERDVKKVRSAVKDSGRAVENAQREAGRLTEILEAADDVARGSDGGLGRDVSFGRDGGVGPANWADLGQDEQEVAAPWSDEEWSRARTRVFLAALDLHAAFVAGAAGQILENMGRLLGLLSRDPGGRGEDLEALWQTLFLLVPVISTTFASCGRMFGAMGRESLGWLLIDEAGQALPQAAVGALWRSRRAVVVGDPMQLRPISQVPDEVQERLRGMFGSGAGVGGEWQPSEVSAQALADRRNKWGVAIDAGGAGVGGAAVSVGGAAVSGAVWVGAPLRVHRRCQEPMFGVSNAIGYGGLMVYGTREQPFPGGSYPEYPRSNWVDVTGLPVGKWVPAQGNALLAVLRRLRDRGGIGLDQVYVLSPFRDVVFRCRALVRQELAGIGVAENAVRDFTQNRIGTVHTTQGKEADVVILVLGADASRGKKARDWAAQPANLLNVAVSRARRRLFVIGDRADWSGAPNFSVLAESLPRVRWPGRQ